MKNYSDDLIKKLRTFSIKDVVIKQACNDKNKTETNGCKGNKRKYYKS